MTKIIIFSDLDGSLLHPKTYSFEEAAPALKAVKEKGISLVLCSSKTRAEVELYRRRLRNPDPFIVENGGAVFTPMGYFTFTTGVPAGAEYLVSVLGTPYARIRKKFVRLRERLHVAVRGFGDMTAEEIAALTGLSREEAELARVREFGEPFVFTGAPDDRFLSAARDLDLRWTRGRLYHLMGDQDKGGAVRLLKKWYASEYAKIISIGLGDGLNDLSLLKEVDYPVLIPKEDGAHDPRVALPRLVRAKGAGPAGWNAAVLELLEDLS